MSKVRCLIGLALHLAAENKRERWKSGIAREESESN